MSTEKVVASQFTPVRLHWFSRRRLIALLWMASAIAVFGMLRTGPVGWDAQVCWKTIQSLHHNSNPYAQGLAALQEFHGGLASGTAVRPPNIYVYSPITLPVMRLLGIFPAWALGLLYGAAVAIGALLQLWAGFQLANQQERRWLVMVLPAMLFFPGLITDDVILSGNIAYIIYGVVLVAAVFGWKRGSWSWYYIAVLAASVWKAPFLSLLAFPVLLDRRQWFQSGITAATGVLIFAAQVRLWPEMFHEYLLTLRLMFDWGHDFGFGPAGVLGRTLSRQGLPACSVTSVLYIVFAVVLAIVLLVIARNVRDWDLPRESWIPLALVGTLLLNPRIMKYDLAAITVPMLLIGWRTLQFAFGHPADERQGCDPQGAEQSHSNRMPILVGAACFLICNAITIAGPTWFPVELLAVLTIFSTGVWELHQAHSKVQPVAQQPRTATDDLLGVLMTGSSVELEP